MKSIYEGSGKPLPEKRCPKCRKKGVIKVDYERFEGTIYWCVRCEEVVKKEVGLPA